MEFLLLGLLGLGLGALLVSNSGSDDDDGTPSPGPEEPEAGTPGDDMLRADGTETLRGGAGDDALGLRGDAFGFGNSGADTLRARDGATAFGNLGDDRIQTFDDASGYGGAGADFLTARDASRMHGDAGNDLLELSGDSTGHGGAGDDFIRGPRDASSFFPSYAQGVSAHGDEGDDLIYSGEDGEGFGDSGQDTLHGYSAALFGGADDDLLIATGAHTGGEGSADTICTAEGGEGDDTIFASYNAEATGGAGNDTLVAARAQLQNPEDADSLNHGPTLTGGAGEDLFVVTSDLENTGTTTITDYDPAEDLIAITVDTFGETGDPQENLRGVEIVRTATHVDLIVSFLDDSTGSLLESSQTIRLENVSTIDPAALRFAVPDASGQGYALSALTRPVVMA